MIERLFDIKYPDLHKWIEQKHLDIYVDWQATVDDMANKRVGTISLGEYLQLFEPDVLKSYEYVVRNEVIRYFRDLLKQEKE